MNNRLTGKDIKLEYCSPDDDEDWVEIKRIELIPKAAGIIVAKTRTSKGDRARKRKQWRNL